MRLLEMALHGCRRLMLNNIRTLRYTPTSMYQLILGTNGSGKSSVVNEMSPLPPDSKDYIKGGWKYTKWDHRGSVYEIRSEFKTTSGKHSFIKDGVELNPGNTQSVSRELARQEFGMTDDIHQMITGQLLFTEMGISEKRKWMTMLCDTDFTFVTGLYNRVSSAARDAQGAVRHLSDRMVSETNKLKALGDTVAWSEEAEILQMELETLYRSRSNRNLTGSESRVSQLLDWECKMAERILSMGNPVSGRYRSLEEIQERAAAIQNEIELVKHSREWTSEALGDLQQLQKTVEGGGVGTLEEAEAELYELNATVARLRGLLEYYTDFKDVDAMAVLNSIDSIKEELSDVLRGIPDNNNLRFNKQAVQVCRDTRISLKKEVEGFTNRVAKEESTLEHLNGTCHTECPNCEHRWLPGNTEQIRKAAEENLAHFQGKLAQSQADLKACEDYLEQAGEFSSYFQRYRGLVSNNPSLSQFWDRMIDVDGINRDPQAWIREFSLFSKDARVYLDIETAERRIERLNLSVDAMRKTDGGVQLKERITQHIAKIASLTEQLQSLARDSDEINNILRLSSQMEKMGHELEQVQIKREEAFKDYVVELRDDTIAEITRGHQTRLAFLNAKLSEKKTIEDLLSDIEASHVDVKLKQEIFKMLSDELSPKDGMIAEQMIGFVKGFAADMNTIVGNVWTYLMEMQPCGLDSGEMDYKFPVKIKGEDAAPDVGKSSLGQKEMFNFAFQLIVMFYLQLDDYPLTLDELGRNFDETHRINVMNFVKDLVETKGFSQVFMISHYASSHGSFTQAEVMVMDSSNISVPTKYNQHVTFE